MINFDNGEIIWQTPTQSLGFGKNITLRNSDMVSDGSVQLIKDIKKSQDPTNVFGVANNVFSD